MRYRDDIQQSAEYLRLALQHMTRQAAGLHPVSYAVWYDYVAGVNPALKKAVEELTKGGNRLNDEATYELYDRYIADISDESSQRISARIERIVADVAESTARAGDQASTFGGALERCSEAIARPQDPGAMTDALQDIRSNTQAMRGAIDTLQARLEASQREAAELKQEVHRVREEALVDALTGLANRRALDRAFEACLAGVQEGGAGPCLLMLDIDHFKRVNDTYGHLFGDKVLQAVGKALQANVKGKDTAARFGGEEFAVLLPGTLLDGATCLAETLRATIAAGRVRNLNSNETVGNITISIGVASYREGETTVDLVARADRALYAAKTLGRNRVSVAGRDEQPAVA